MIYSLLFFIFFNFNQSRCSSFRFLIKPVNPFSFFVLISDCNDRLKILIKTASIFLFHLFKICRRFRCLARFLLIAGNTFSFLFDICRLHCRLRIQFLFSVFVLFSISLILISLKSQIRPLIFDFFCKRCEQIKSEICGWTQKISNKKYYSSFYFYFLKISIRFRCLVRRCFAAPPVFRFICICSLRFYLPFASVFVFSVCVCSLYLLLTSSFCLHMHLLFL